MSGKLGALRDIRCEDIDFFVPFAVEALEPGLDDIPGLTSVFHMPAVLSWFLGVKSVAF